MKVILYPHGGSGNHGCEAIVRATHKICGAEMALFSNNPSEDCKYLQQNICKIHNAHSKIKRLSLKYLSAFVKYHIGKQQDAFNHIVFSPIFKAGKDADIAFSIGGDNYCYGAPALLYYINRQLSQQGTKLILWGCSIEPDAIDSNMLDDLRLYSHIIARESITFSALKNHGLKNISILPDPAFVLDKCDLPLPDGFIPGNTIGINVSPMIIGYEKNDGATMTNYVNLIKHIISTTDMTVALIPHVVWSHNDDRRPLSELYDLFKDSGRVIMIDDHNAEELKGYIARCRFFIAARTHASIAAYSSCVPTLVVGYSVKARGIAHDLFGTYDNYVIPVQSLVNDNHLTNAFEWMLQNEQQIRQHLTEFIPRYSKQVYNANKILESLL
ncbi:MAG: polysaccharide pyruvyl transferase family protein [Muribaculaceae bacterium]|nr:polysaccharide pyruvyl transferase family protein [Muribaculaceae bacterium]